MMTSGQYSKTTQREPTTTIQSIPSVTQDSTADTKCKQTDAVGKPLPSQVTIPKKTTSFASSTTHKEHKAATADSSSSSSCNLVPRETVAAVGLSEDFLLYNDNLDEEMSCDLDSSLEGKLLIDESMSDEESGTKDEEVLKSDALPVSQLDKPTSSIPVTEKKSNQVQKGTKGASETELSPLKELLNDEPNAISSTNTERENADEKVDDGEENDLKKMTKSYSESLDVASKDSWSTNSKVSGETEEFFADTDINKTLDSKEEHPKIDSEKTFNESNKTVLKETKNNFSDTILGTAETSPREVLNKPDSEAFISEQICAKEHSTQSIQKLGDKELSTSKAVPRTVSPDSTTYAGDESCRLSFVLIEDCFLCLSCSKLFKNERFFKQHVWRHFHISSMQLLCKPCLSNKDSSQCPAVKEIFTMLHNSCSKDVSSLHLELLLNTSPAKEAVISNQTVWAENLPADNSNYLQKNLHLAPESRDSEPMPPLKDESQNVECLIFCILSQLFVCLKCNKRIDTAKLAQHIYNHLHSLSLPEHGSCVNEKECDIMDKIIPPMMSSIDVDKEDFYILKISWKWTVQRDLRYRVQLVRHYPNNEASSDNHAIASSRQELQLVKSWYFLILNQQNKNSWVNTNHNDIEIIGSKQMTHDNVSLDSAPVEKETPSLVLTKAGYKKITFVIRLGRYICKACRKIYANLDLLNSHIMWHFHSHEKVCSLDHYDGLPLKGKQCPILSNIENCIRKLDQETKMLNVYWKTDTNGKTYFHMQIVLPKENSVIDLSSQESNNEYEPTSNQDEKNISKRDAVIVIDDNSMEANLDQNEEVSFFRKSSKSEDYDQKQIRINLLTERQIPKLEMPKLEIPKLEMPKLEMPKLEIQKSEIPKLEIQKSEIPKLEIQKNQFYDEKLFKTFKCFENIGVASVQNPPLNSEGGFYVCGFSDCRFSSIESERFFEHLKTSHCHEKRFLCIHCHHSAPSVELLMKHFDSHTNQTLFLLYQCATCEYATNMLLEFEKHLHSNHAKSNNFLCRYCKQTFTSIELLVKHLNKNLLKFIKCPSCSARDTYRRRMLRHIAARHPNTPRQIVVSSQIICKTISQNKLLNKETRVQDAKPMMQTSKVGFDEEQEGNDLSKRETVIKSNESANKDAKSVNNYSPINRLSNLISNIDSISTQNVYCELTYNQDDEMNTNFNKNVISPEFNSPIIDDTVGNAAEFCNDNREIQRNMSPKKQSSILVELLSHTNENVQEGNDILSRLYVSAQKGRNSSEEKGVDDSKLSKVAKEDRTIKENYKLHSDVKIVLTRTNWPNETGGLKNVSSDQAFGSGKERNLFQLFGGMEKNTDIHRSQSPGVEEAPVLDAESQPVLDKNDPTFEDMNRDDGANTDSPCTEESSDEKIQAPSQLHEISLGGSTLDLHLQKCYTYSKQPSQPKQLSCIICHHVSKTLYRMHLHLLCDHFKWPLWECQDCGLRVYSHSKITTHCWRIHRNQSPRIKSLQLPIIELDKDNEFVVVNTQEEFVGSSKATLLTETMKKKPAAASVPSKSKKNKSTTDVSVSLVEDLQPIPKSPRKRSKSTSSDKSDPKKKKTSSSEVVLEDMSNAVEPTPIALSASVDDEQPPEVKSEISTDVDRKEKKCSMCGFTCSLKTEMFFLQHMILEHMKEYKYQISDREIKLVEEAITGNSLDGFSCPFCYYGTKQRVDCKIHIWRTHARLKLLDCTQCKFVTWFERHMKRHVLKRHGGSKEESKPSQKNETPGDAADSSDKNQTLLNSLKALSTLKSIIQKKQNQGTSTEPVKPSLCSSCENVTLVELKDQLKKQQLKLLNGDFKADRTKSVSQKPLPKTKTSSTSHSQADKKDDSTSKKKLNPSTDSTELSSKPKKPKTSSSVSIPASTSNNGGSNSSSKEKNSAKKPIPTELKGILPKPPFPLEKSSSSKKHTSSSKKESAAGSKNAQSKRSSSSANRYVETKCSKTGKKLYKCPVCSAVKKSISDIEYHWKKYQNTIYRCSQCTYKRHLSDHVLQHIKKEHQNKGNVRSFQIGNSQTEKSKAEK